MPYRVVTSFNTERRRFAMDQVIANDEDLGGASIADIEANGFIVAMADEPPAEPAPDPANGA